MRVTKQVGVGFHVLGLLPKYVPDSKTFGQAELVAIELGPAVHRSKMGFHPIV